MKRIITVLAKKYIPFNFRIFLRRLRYFLLGLTQSILYYDKRKLFDPLTCKNYYVFVRRNNDAVNYFNFSNSRQRLVFFYYQKFLEDFFYKGFTLLHIAPEYALYRFFNKIEGVKYIPADKKSLGYDYPSGTMDIDITHMTRIASSSIDLFICNHVLEHIEDDNKAISEIFRVLKIYGTAIITVPLDDKQEKTYENPEIIHPDERKKHFGQWDHVRKYGKDIVDKFKSAEFQVDLIKPSVFINEDIINTAIILDEYLIILKKL